jgi:hypothetical protein
MIGGHKGVEVDDGQIVRNKKFKDEDEERGGVPPRF